MSKFTDDQIEAIKKKISSFSPKSDRMAWKRRHASMVELIEKLNGVEDEILKIILEKKYPIMDEITKLRQKMLENCIHPSDHLVVGDDGVAVCKFCNTRLRCKI